MLERSRTPGAEEWAIHDYEGFGPLRLGEHEELATISQIGQGMPEHGPAFAHWAAICGTSDRENGLGSMTSTSGVESYAEELLGDLGIDDLIERAVPEHLQARPSTSRVLDEMTKLRSATETERALQERRLAKLRDERKRLLDAHYADAIPRDLLKREQARIAAAATAAGAASPHWRATSPSES